MGVGGPTQICQHAAGTRLSTRSAVRRSASHRQRQAEREEERRRGCFRIRLPPKPRRRPEKASSGVGWWGWAWWWWRWVSSCCVSPSSCCAPSCCRRRHGWPGARRHRRHGCPGCPRVPLNGALRATLRVFRRSVRACEACPRAGWQPPATAAHCGWLTDTT
jgi:hypothetical protein